VNAWHARLAVRSLRRGGLVLHATEGVWGLACDPGNASAVALLLALKARPVNKGLIVIGACAGWFSAELAGVDPRVSQRVVESWPGAVTWVLPSRRFAPWVTGGRDTVAVRVPGHPQARALCHAFGAPLVSSSANRAGRPPARRHLRARAFVRDLRRRGLVSRRGEELYLLPGETLGLNRASDIRGPDGSCLRRAR
jgi:L-threonylcarbamoyladenylate synthase